MRPLTPRQSQVLEFIRGFVSRNGYAPTHREIGDAVGIRSTNGVNDHLSRLERKGYIRRRSWGQRAIQLTQPKLGSPCSLLFPACTKVKSATSSMRRPCTGL